MEYGCVFSQTLLLVGLDFVLAFKFAMANWFLAQNGIDGDGEFDFFISLIFVAIATEMLCFLELCSHQCVVVLYLFSFSMSLYDLRSVLVYIFRSIFF